MDDKTTGARGNEDCEHEDMAERDNGTMTCNGCGETFLPCPGCSEAGGAGSPVYHPPPLCRTSAEERAQRSAS